MSGKRLFDVILSVILIIVLSPLFLLIALMIKIEDGGKIFFSQERIGISGKPFQIYKFRTMSLDAEKDGPILSPDSEDCDARISKTGRFLRAHHLDELPQLWNVLIGDMSFVGHRPERKYFIDQIMEQDSRYSRLYSIRPGITSYATLFNGYTDTMEKMLKRLEYDLDYLDNNSLRIDLGILWKTFIFTISGKQF